MRKFEVKLVGLALLVAIAVSVAPTLTAVALAKTVQQTAQQSQTVQQMQERVERGPEHAVEVLVSRVNLTIARIYEFSENYNITLDENMTSLLKEAEELIKEAEGLKETSASEALSKVLQAARLVTPVYVYVIQNLPPKVKDDFAVRRTEAQFQVRERTLMSLNKTVDWLAKRGVNIPEWVRADITKGFELIAVGRQSLQEGNITKVKEVLKEVDEIIKTVTQALRVGLRVKWVNVVCSEKVLTSLVAQVNALIHIVNDSAESLEAEDVKSAVSHLNAASKKADDVLDLINALKPYASGRDEYVEILNVSEEIVTTLKEAVDDATAYLEGEEPDTTTALQVLSNALDKVQPLFDQLKTLAKWKFGELDAVKGLIIRVRDRVREKVGKMVASYVKAISKLNDKVNQLNGSFKSLTALYRNNKISCNTYLRLMDAMRQTIEGLSSQLSPGIHEQHRARLNTLYNQVVEELSNTKC